MVLIIWYKIFLLILTLTLKLKKKNGLLFDENSKLVNEISYLDGVENVSIVLENKLLATHDDYQLVINAKGVGKSYNKVTGIDNEIVLVII